METSQHRASQLPRCSRVAALPTHYAHFTPKPSHHMNRIISSSSHRSALGRRDQFGKRTHLHNPAAPGTACPGGTALTARGTAALFRPHSPMHISKKKRPNRSGKTQNCVIISVLNNRILHGSDSLRITHFFSATKIAPFCAKNDARQLPVRQHPECRKKVAE